MSVKKEGVLIGYREWLDNATFGMQGDNEEHYKLAKAAPMLYEACKLAYSALEKQININDEGRVAFDKLYDALASAEGRG